MRLSRRQLLGAAGGLLASPVTRPDLLPAAGGGTGVLTLTWRRRLDFAELAFDLYNLRADRTGRTLHAVDPHRPSYVVVRFPTQSVAESTSPDTGAQPAGPVLTRAAEPSRLAFEVTGLLPYPATLDALLAWNRWTPRVVPLALARTASCAQPGTLPRAPLDTETSLEIPYRLQLSPHAGAGWAHRVTPSVGTGGWTELWHTRLGVRKPSSLVDEDDAGDRTVRAVWARYDQMAAWIQSPPASAPSGPQTPPAAAVPDSPDDPAGLAMPAGARLDIVRLTCDPRLSSCTAPGTLDREPIEVDSLMLTSLGGWLASSAKWATPATGPQAPTLSSWQHRATMGRDHYVRLTYDGYLYPFGHRATLVEVSERKILDGPAGRGGYLVKRSFIVIRQRERDYTGDAARPDQQRGLPFTHVRALLETTPDIDLPTPEPDFFPVTVGATYFSFPWRGTDHGGHEVDFQAPAMFVKGALLPKTGDPVASLYNTLPPALRAAAVGGLPVVTAPDAARMPVHAMELGGADSFPSVQAFTAEVPQISALTGVAGAVNARLRYFGGYQANGFGGESNPGEVFLEAVPLGTDKLPRFDLPGDATGLATPQMAVQGLSRTSGLVAGELKDAAIQQLDPSRLFDGGAKLLGDLKLTDVLEPLAKGTANARQAMTITTQELSDGVETRLTWKPRLREMSILELQDDSALELDVRITTRLGRPPVHDTSGTLSAVTLRFFTKDGWFIKVPLKTLRFTDSSGAKPDVHCDIGEVQFGDSLSFVKELATLLSFGKGNGVSVVPSGDRVTVALDVAVPDLSVGILALSNIAIHVGLELPFDGSPVVFDADFATREHKFVLGVGILRGGGFAGLSMTANGLQSIEFAFEFGAGVSIDLGVASGCVEVMAGLYFKLSSTPAGQAVELTAYLRVRGSMSVLGLITVTVEFYLSLTWQSKTGSLLGEATMTVTVDLFLFSQSVSVTCRRELTRTQSSFDRRAPALGSSPVRFGDVFTPDLWARHCAAFAPA